MASKAGSARKKVETVGDAQRMQLLVDAVIDYAIYMLTPDGIVASWNSGAARIKGYTAAEIVGQHFSVFYAATDRANGEPAHALATAARDGRYEKEGWRVRKDGTTFAANVVLDAIRAPDGALLGFAEVTRDVTGRRRAEEELRQSQLRFEMLVKGVTDYAIYMLTPEGIVASWNAGAERIKQYTADEIVGRHFSTFYTPEDRAAGKPERALSIAALEGKFEAEGTRVRKDGTTFAASVVIDAIYDELGNITGFAKITRDVTERRKVEAKLAEAQAALAQSQKMEAIGQLTGGVAHDFNNLLTVITNALDIVKRPNVDAARRDRVIDAAQRAAQRGARLNQQLLAFARRQPLHTEVHDVDHLIRAFESVLRRGAGEAVEIEVRGADGCAADIDSAQFESSLLNLVVNARDAMNGAGRLIIDTRIVPRSAIPHPLADMKADRYIAVSVTDTGTGMSPEVRDRAFEPFFTTKEIGKGSGLGLSQVYGFAVQSGGCVDLRSEAGRGTTVTMYLPASDAPAVAASDAVDGHRGTLHSDTILLVEDDADVMDVTLETLRSLGYTVRSAPDAPTALQTLRGKERIDILFSDVVMPRGMNGFALAREARALRPHLPVLLASGYPLSAMPEDEGLNGNYAFVSKPYRWPELVDKLRVLRGR